MMVPLLHHRASRFCWPVLILIGLILAVIPGAVGATMPMSTLVLQSGPSHPFGERTESIADRHVYDFAGALDDPEIVTISSDADRLQRHGMPAVIITIASDMAPEEAANVAAAVRQDWDIGSVPGADDGLVFLVVLPEPTGGSTYAILSWGANALPLEGLTGPVSESVYQQWISPWLAEPQVFEAVTYGLRRMIYHIIYEPAPQAPLTGARDVAHDVAEWLGILALIACAAGWIAFRLGLRLPGPASSLPGWLVELSPFLMIAALACLSVVGHSRIGVACASVLLPGFLLAWVRRDPGWASVHAPAATPGRRVAP